MKPELKKLLILNAPYLLFVYLFDKIGQAVRFSPGADLSGKVLSLADGFSAAFANPLPSLVPIGFSRVWEALTARRVSDKGAEHDKF